MSAPAIDPRWAKILSLTVHELRTPMTVVSGYIRMLLKERAGAVTDPQRRILEEAEKSCARLSALTLEISELSALEAGTVALRKSPIDLRATLKAAVAALPPQSDRDVPVTLELPDAPAMIDGDPGRLGQAFGAIVAALRREVIADAGLIVRDVSPAAGAYALRLGDPDTLAAFDADPDRPVFDEWRGGVGLSLIVARRLIEAHGGRLLGAPGGRKSGASIELPSG
jgi:signal transduction histidine kinase